MIIYTRSGNSFFLWMLAIDCSANAILILFNLYVYYLLEFQFIIEIFLQQLTYNLMTELSALFRSQSYINPPSPFQKTMQYMPSMGQNSSSPNQRYYYNSSPLRQARPFENISNQAKKIITSNNMQEEASWFQQNNLIQCLAKIGISWVISTIGLYFSLIGTNLFLCLVIFGFLFYGLQHNIFGTQLFKNWVQLSLVGTILVLSNQVFMLLAKKLSANFASQLLQTYQSLVPSVYVTVIVIIFLISLPLISQQHAQTSLIKNLLTFPKSSFKLISLIYKLKVAIAQIYAIMAAGTFFISVILQIRERNWDNIVQFVALLFHPIVILAEFLTFWIVILIVHFYIKTIGYTVEIIGINGFYGKKNKDTRLPFMLQLLRISPNDVFVHRNMNSNFPNLLQSLSKLLKLDFSNLQSRQAKITAQQLENVNKHSLRWLASILLSNPYSLNTKINTSRFYNTYFDIFKQFTESQLLNCSSTLFSLEKNIQNLNSLKMKGKSIKQDLFYWAKILRKQFQVWDKAVECCKLLSVTDIILDIINLAEIDKDLWKNSSIGNSFIQIKDKASHLSKAQQINPAIRSKMEQYSNKIYGIMRK